MPNATEAVTRILHRAAQRAALRGAALTGPLDLLAEILAEESRGAALLREAGLSEESIAEALRLPDVSATTIPLHGTAAGRSPELELILEAAHRQATDEGRHAELGSHHLALALTEVASPARSFLEEAGVRLEQVRLHGEPSEESVPIAAAPEFLLNPEVERLERREILRAIDAAANRASEGFRVAEDVTRFVLDDAHLTGCLKDLRHEVPIGLSGIPRGERLAARDSRGDVGRRLVNPTAASRQGSEDLLAANLRRAAEALRSLEEFTRLLDTATGDHFERLRYDLYTIEKALAVTQTAWSRLAGHRICLLLTQALCRLPLEETIRGAATGGARIIQVREKRLGDRELLDHLHRVREITRQSDALLIVNDRPDLARLCGADGVHLGQDDLSPEVARRIVGKDCLVGVSTHSLEQARQAVLEGADYLGVGPVYPSGTKSFEQFVGLELIERVAREIRLPWFAIGGINQDNVADVRAAGAERVAVTGAIGNAADARVAAATLREALRTK